MSIIQLLNLKTRLILYDKASVIHYIYLDFIYYIVGNLCSTSHSIWNDIIFSQYLHYFK